MADCVREPLCSGAMLHLDIAPLSTAAVQSLLNRVHGHHVCKSAVSALMRAGDGSVLYLRELELGAQRAGRLVLHRGLWQLVESQLSATPQLAELVRERLAPGRTGRSARAGNACAVRDAFAG
jgi:hypothetical protein